MATRFDSLFPNFLSLQKCEWKEDPDFKKTVLEDAVYSPDSSILIALYELEGAAVVLEKLSDLANKKRLFLTHQACLEFINNRAEKVTETNDKSDDYLKDYKQLADKCVQVGNKTEYRTIQLNVSTLVKAHNKTFEDHQKQVDEDKKKKDQGTDAVMVFLRSLNEEVIGSAFSESKMQELAQEAFIRNSRLEPPGFHDTPKMGDFVIWNQLIEYATGKHNIVFITNDVKSDWYCHLGQDKTKEDKRRNEVTHPRHELIEEFSRRTKGKQFHAITFSAFAKLENLPPELKLEIDNINYADIIARLMENANPPKSKKEELFGNCQNLEHEMDTIISTFGGVESHAFNVMALSRDWMHLLNEIFTECMKEGDNINKNSMATNVTSMIKAAGHLASNGLKMPDREMEHKFKIMRDHVRFIKEFYVDAIDEYKILKPFVTIKTDTSNT